MAVLCPAQQQAFDVLHRMRPVSPVGVLTGSIGAGKSTVLWAMHQMWGGAFLTLKDFIEGLRGRHPLAMEETFEQMVLSALLAHDVVLMDDLQVLYTVLGCSPAYPRVGLLQAPLLTLSTYARAAQKTLLFSFGYDLQALPSLHARATAVAIGDFTAADYEGLCRQHLPAPAADRLDYAKIYRFAPKLNAHQLQGACQWFQADAMLDTARFIDYLRSQHLTSNVDLGEVQAVHFQDLKGVDDVIQSLEANIILPLEHDELAAQLQLKPKRGVLLAGPPGTGKTTIGRALAHRLKSKFFLIDGTFIAGTGDFYRRIHQVFEAAKQNAPSIIFIDDSDAIFESGEELGLYRYLLTMLDGLESASTGRVCVMMTAMDVGHLPPALIRSGRIELWLETRLPDPAARTAILTTHSGQLPTEMAEIDIPGLTAATEGFTGADLKRLIEDGKMLYAYDRAYSQPLRPITEYMQRAVETVRANKARYAEAEARARQQRPQRPPWYEALGGLVSFTLDHPPSGPQSG